jgi:hypothetical protein
MRRAAIRGLARIAELDRAARAGAAWAALPALCAAARSSTPMPERLEQSDSSSLRARATRPSSTSPSSPHTWLVADEAFAARRAGSRRLGQQRLAAVGEQLGPIATAAPSSSRADGEAGADRVDVTAASSHSPRSTGSRAFVVVQTIAAPCTAARRSLHAVRRRRTVRVPRP